MNELLIDIGNTRIKLALIDSQGYDYLGGFSLQDVQDEASALDFFEQLDFSPEAVYISSVASADMELVIHTAVTRKWKVLPVFMSTQLSCCGLKNGYVKPTDLGVDRWLVMVAANALCKNRFLVIDAGTALTIDLVCDQQHQGGFIVPGLQTLRHSLTHQTANLNSDCHNLGMSVDHDPSHTKLADTTQSGICGGTLYMMAAYVNQVVVDIKSLSDETLTIFVTGGDGLLLKSLMTYGAEYIEDLVLKGIHTVKENIKN